ncbi:MAG: oxidoreductase protein [Bacilli bacterium]|nr:oxidoreductase protein [Bacilli bacterium]
MNKLRVAVVGCGSITKYRHAPEYAFNEHVELVAFCDLVRDRALLMAEQYGGNVYTDYLEMLQKEKPDAVSVCTSNINHAPVSIAAAKLGIHVLCEKPMATSEADGLAMIAAAKENGAILMVGHNQRLMPAHVKAKEILNAGDLGRVLTFRTAFGHPGPEDWSIEGKEGWFFQKDKAIVGAMGDLGVHKADLIRWILDDEVTEISAFVETLHKEDTKVDDNAICILRTRKGTIGTLTASWTYYKGEDNSTILYCEHGVIKIGTDPHDQVIVEKTDGSVQKFAVGAIATNTGQTHSGVIDAFITSIVTKTPPPISGEEGLRSLKVILAALESAASKKLISIS